MSLNLLPFLGGLGLEDGLSLEIEESLFDGIGDLEIGPLASCSLSLLAILSSSKIDLGFCTYYIFLILNFININCGNGYISYHNFFEATNLNLL